MRRASRSWAATTAISWSICSGGPAITVWRGEAYTATVTCGCSAINASVPAASSSSSAIAPWPDSRAINRDRVAMTCSPSASRQGPGHHRRGHLTHRMPDHRVRLDPVGPPQRGQRQLHADQHRLDVVDPGDRLPTGQHLLQRKPGLRHEHRLQLGHRRGELRLIRQQLPAHARPLRALAGVDEHRARPAGPLMRADHPYRGLSSRQRPQARHGLAAITGAHRGEVRWRVRW